MGSSGLVEGGDQAVAAVRDGDVARLRQVLAEHPGLAASRLWGAHGSRTLLHVVTDWPGLRPKAAKMVRVLVEAGADVDAAFLGAHAETPLHWAASSDDVSALDALLDCGANIDAPGGSVGDGSGTPLFDATVFGQWAAAARLVERGAAAGPWEAAAMGLVQRLVDFLDAQPPPSRPEVTAWFWAACHGGQLGAAKLLLVRGADRDWSSDWDGLTPLDAAQRSAGEGCDGAAEVVDWLRGQGARTADVAGSPT